MRVTEEKKYKLNQVSVRLKLCEEPPLYSTEQIDTPRRAIEVMKDMLRQLDREYVCVVNLDNGNRPINFNVVSIGSINSSIVTMRELLKSAILSNSTSLILLHSHPSYRTEIPKPSREDDITTLNVMMATDLMGIKLQDHIIVSGGTGSVYSYKKELGDRFCIEGLQELIEERDKRALVNEKAEEYKPLTKVEELEEENYNQIDNYLSNTTSKSGERREQIRKEYGRRKPLLKEERPSVRAMMREKKAALSIKNREKASEIRQKKSERAV